MFAFVITIHILGCVLLILIVLVQQGRGGGLIDTFSSAESIFGTKTDTFLVKSTTALAVIFFLTCLSLAFLSIQRNKSLVATSYKPVVEEAAHAAQKKPPLTTDVQKPPADAPAPETSAPLQTPE